MAIDLDKLNARLAALPKAAREAIEARYELSGKELVTQMQILAPVSHENNPHGLPAGALRDSIVMTLPGGTTPTIGKYEGITVPDDAIIITAGNEKVTWAHFVEYGTTKAPAEPFFWPAYRMLKSRIAAEVKKAASDAIKEAWSK